MAGGLYWLLIVATGIAGGLIGNGVAQSTGISLALGVVVLCADAICSEIRVRR